MVRVRQTDVLYENYFSSDGALGEFVLEGQAHVSVNNGALRLQNVLDPSLGQSANFVLWNKRDFPDKISIEWDFYPMFETGLAMMFFAAKGVNGEDIFDPSLPKRTGRYEMYYNGAINAYHISYYRKTDGGKEFCTCNMRKSKGFYLVCQGADPIPCLSDCIGPYHIKIVKYGVHVAFYINDMEIFYFLDDGVTYGGVHSGGKVGFRQMAPLVAEYKNLKICSLELID